MASGRDNRRTQRRNVRYKATIENVLDGRLETCQILDVSATGAKLQVARDLEVAEHFILHLAPGGGSRRVCRLIWRADMQIGAAFVGDGEATI